MSPRSYDRDRRTGGDANFAGILFFILVVILVAIATWRGVRLVQFNMNCAGYISRAAHANTVELAAPALLAAVEYAEARGLRSGNTGIFWRTPSNDVGFWHDNLVASLEELNSIGENSTVLERSNALMKLREALMADGERGQSVRAPDGIDIYPMNREVTIIFWVVAAFTFIAFIAAGYAE